MNDDYCFMKRVLSVLIFAILLMAACSPVQELPPEPVVETAPVTTKVSTPNSDITVISRTVIRPDDNLAAVALCCGAGVDGDA